AIVRIKQGKGSVIISFSEFGITPSALQNGLLPSYSQLLNMEISKQQLFSVGNEQLSFITNRLDSTTYTVGVFNNSLSQKGFLIESKIGNIKDIAELDLCSGQPHISSYEGYWPEFFQSNNGGVNTATSIMGGDVRFFKIQLENLLPVNAVYSDSIKYAAFPTNRYLYFPSLNNSGQNIMRWKTMLYNFEGIMLDWSELLVADKATIKKNSNWLNLQNLKVLVDFSRGFDNEFRRLAQDENSKMEILGRLTNIFDKMQDVFSQNATNVVFQIPAGLTNNDVKDALNSIALEAKKRNIILLVYSADGVSSENCLSIINSVSQTNANIKYVLNTATISDIESGIVAAGNALGAVMIQPDNVVKSYVPVQNLNSTILQIFNFNCSNWDDAYNVLKNVTQKTEPLALGLNGLLKPDIKDVAGEIADNYKTSPLNSGYYLTFRNITDIKKEALAIADTLFAYYGGVMVESRYLASRDSLSLVNDCRWLNAKGLKIVVDMSQELNSFPDLCWFEYAYVAGKPSNTNRMEASQQYMRKVVDKMQIIGAESIIIGAHNGPENDNGFSMDQFAGIERFVTYCKTKSIKVHFQNNEYNQNAEGTTYNSAINVETFVASMIANKSLTNFNFASNSINRLALSSSKIYIPTLAPLGALIIGGSSTSANRVPTPISLDTRIAVTGLSSYPNALKILDGGYEINKSTFAYNAGKDARYLKRVKNQYVNDTPVFTSSPVTMLRNEGYHYTVTATDKNNDILTYRKAVLPSWLNFDTSTHTITGSAPQSAAGKQFPAKILVSDGTIEAAQSFTITVDAYLGVQTNRTLQNEISISP
ncbi:MAG: putative Ig domain-containing protein, partial [Bacteroidia bacterium]|nr:putative Ig domain-containing protein [Bacteroidia bacterium]